MNYTHIILLLILFILLFSLVKCKRGESLESPPSQISNEVPKIEAPPATSIQSALSADIQHPEMINSDGLQRDTLIANIPTMRFPEEVYHPVRGLLTNEETERLRSAEGAIMNPDYLRTERALGRVNYDYKDGVLQEQGMEIKRLKGKVMALAKVIDSGDTDRYRDRFYKRSVSNKFYPVRPVIASIADDSLNLYDDDFSTKTLSTIKFLEQTQPSKFYGAEIHFPSELCGNFCPSLDQNVATNEQVDVVRPVNYVPKRNK